MALLRQADALKQAEQVEFALRGHLVQNLVGREIVDADDHPLAELARFWAGARRFRAPSPPFRREWVLWSRAAWVLFSAGSVQVHAGFAGRLRLTLGGQSEILRPIIGSGGYDEDCDSGPVGRSCGDFAA